MHYFKLLFPVHAAPPCPLTLSTIAEPLHTPLHMTLQLLDMYPPYVGATNSSSLSGQEKHARGGCRATARLSERPLPIVRLRASIVSVITPAIAPPLSGRRSGFRPPIVVLNRSLAKSGRRFRIHLTCAYRLGHVNEIGPTAPAQTRTKKPAERGQPKTNETNERTPQTR